MASYTGKEKASLNNIKSLWQYITGGGAQAIRKAMGLGDTLGAVPIANGGTGATTAAVAFKNIVEPQYPSNEDLLAYLGLS